MLTMENMPSDCERSTKLYLLYVLSAGYGKSKQTCCKKVDSCRRW